MYFVESYLVGIYQIFFSHDKTLSLYILERKIIALSCPFHPIILRAHVINMISVLILTLNTKLKQCLRGFSTVNLLFVYSLHTVLVEKKSR